MAHPIYEKLSILEKKEPHICDETCKYWRFPHLETACVLSDVFSVKKGEFCYTYISNQEAKE